MTRYLKCLIPVLGITIFAHSCQSSINHSDLRNQVGQRFQVSLPSSNSLHARLREAMKIYSSRNPDEIEEQDGTYTLSDHGKKNVIVCSWKECVIDLQSSIMKNNDVARALTGAISQYIDVFIGGPQPALVLKEKDNDDSISCVKYKALNEFECVFAISHDADANEDQDQFQSANSDTVLVKCVASDKAPNGYNQDTSFEFGLRNINSKSEIDVIWLDEDAYLFIGGIDESLDEANSPFLTLQDETSVKLGTKYITVSGNAIDISVASLRIAKSLIVGQAVEAEFEFQNRDANDRYKTSLSCEVEAGN